MYSIFELTSNRARAKLLHGVGHTIMERPVRRLHAKSE
jgi:hypothetical protein